MRITGKLIGVSLLSMTAACSSLSSLNPFKEKDKNPPAALVDIKSPIPAKVVWKHSVGKAGLYVFSPALADNALFVADADGNIERLDAATGRSQWKVKAGTDLTAGVGANGKLVAVGGAKGTVMAFDAATGKVQWKVQASSEVLSAPAVTDELVIVRSMDNKITAYDTKTGDRKWFLQRTTPPLTLRNAPGMVVAQPNVYVAQPAGKLLSLALSNGVPRFEVSVAEPRGATELERVSDIGGTPVVIGSDICAVTYQGKVGCFDLSTGAAKWSKPASSDVGVGADQRFVFVADDKGHVSAFSREGGASAWKNDSLGNRALSTPLSYGRVVAVGDFQGYVHLLSREDGAMLGRVATDGSPIKSVPVVAGSNMIFQTQSGTVTAIAVE
ncbi:outer membrane protein assembly factor BamB [Pseudoduganella albidiflava]|uniref:Outer membrane protein assembly factor BamB n=1 Tax=Pseudoduganella albidiflava TaxID=321983 RepID=A0A411WV23_9BURK|nr:outer membrane protein assembly factor BamB [Pseudoduganella albidiflava]QBI00479.1 outer membrane protein assembly factor BamB [Pseudoduganella albidiflava]GGY33000.1 outer membrane protein assembly factor BamB [Pseudoduganella albidiflava]